MIREWERLRKAKWQSFKFKHDPDNVEKVRKYDRERKKNLHNGMEFTSRKASPSPTKVKSPSYYKVLSTSKKVQNLLGPSPKTHTTILKHLLNKAIRSPRKSKCMEKYRSPPKNFVMPPKELVGKQLRKVAILKSHKKYKEVKEVATSLQSKFKVSEIAALSRESMHAIYRLLSPEQKCRLQKQYVKKLTQEDKDEVINIYHDDEVSYSLPDIKYANLRFMHFTLREAYAVYVRKC